MLCKMSEKARNVRYNKNAPYEDEIMQGHCVRIQRRIVGNKPDTFDTFLCLRASDDELHLMFVAANSVPTSLAFEQHVI